MRLPDASCGLLSCVCVCWCRAVLTVRCWYAWGDDAYGDGSGALDSPGLQEALALLGIDTAPEEAEALIAKIDASEAGESSELLAATGDRTSHSRDANARSATSRACTAFSNSRRSWSTS